MGKEEIILEKRANRVKAARMFTGLNRNEFSNAAGISVPTIKSWELRTQTKGISKKGLKRFIKVLDALGIYCSEEWLWDGVGDSPRVKTDKGVNKDNKKNKDMIPYVFWGEDEIIMQEIKLFKDHNLNSISCMITDDAMMPFLKKGDYVCGKFIERDKFKIANRMMCICININDIMLVRKVIYNPESDKINLFITNENSFEVPIVSGEEIKKVAPILFIRKKLQI